ncbi:hypothetical protein CYMTET_38358 [Cymbomonas tetramitiformis]|uniref:Uncharacterized protein n=1 Tax=Cymbomonas tetramitiformis TaxID=36881 RepID=A0AAE0F5J5_9CHLO|nr:hypothetical protein CYMTET_38358 [Cymbomonas tetramitiformis]
MNPYANEYVPGAYGIIVALEAQNAVYREILRLPPTSSAIRRSTYLDANPTKPEGRYDPPCRKHAAVQCAVQRNHTCSQTSSPTECQRVRIGDRRFADVVVARSFWNWKERATRVEHRFACVSNTIRRRATLQRVMTAWIHFWVVTKRITNRVSRALHHWRAVVLHDFLLRTQAKQAMLIEQEDEHVMMTQRNTDLHFALQTLQADLAEETLRLKNSRGTNTELLKRLAVSGECIRSMRKDYVMTCNHCQKWLFRMHQTDRTDSKNATCSFVANEEFVDASSNETVAEFANVQMKEMLLSDITSPR